MHRWLVRTQRSENPNVRSTVRPTRIIRSSCHLGYQPAVRHHEITEVRGKLEVAPAGIPGEAVLQERLQLLADIPADLGLSDPGN